MSALVYIPGAMPSFGLDGQPVTATLSFYEAETAQPTPVTVYADPALSTSHPWPVESDASGRFPAIYVPDDGLYRVAWATSDGQSDSWDEVSGMTTANAGVLNGALTAKAGAEAAQTAAEAARDDAQDILDQVIAQGGDDGWTPVLNLTTDGVRIVVAITWTGGDGPAPTSGYLGSTGVVTNIASAVDIRGPSGPGTGDVLKTGTSTAGHLVTWAGSGLQIQDGGAYDWSTLPNKPAFGDAILLNLASQAEALSGTSNTTLMTPLRVAQTLAGTSSITLPSSIKTANYQAVLNDRGSLIVLDSSSAFTLSFDACATLTNGWWAYLYNANTGDVTLDPSGSEQIDGLSSFVMYPGEMRLVRCNGTALTSYVLKGFSKTYTASGTFTKPPGYNDFEGEAWGGGGSGNSNSEAAGGGGGACVPFKLPASTVGTSEVVTVGSGGSAVTNTPTGTAGGNTTLGSLVTAYGGGGARALSGGGGGGTLGAPSGSDQTGGAPDSGVSANPGFGGGWGQRTADARGGGSVYGGGGGGYNGSPSGPGGETCYGGGGGGAASLSATNDSLGGVSRFGGSGGRGRYNAAGVAGSAPGGGGGGTADTTKSSGAGARGELRIRGIT